MEGQVTSAGTAAVMAGDLLAAAEREWLRQQSVGRGRFFASRVALAPLAGEMARCGEAGVASRYLADEELAVWRSFTLAKRRLEWLGGRLAAKHAAMAYAGAAQAIPEWRRWRLDSLASGRPVLAAGVEPLPAVSISHSHGQAVALAADAGCGIDIQRPSPTVVKVQARFCSPEEETLLASLRAGFGDEIGLTLLWAAKEAVRKALPLSPLVAFSEVELVAVGGAPTLPGWLDLRWRRGGQGMLMRVGVFVTGGFAVAVAMC